MPDVDIPNELTSFSSLGNSNNNYFATIYTPTAAGLFRVCATIVTSTGASNSGAVNIGWTDSNGFTETLGGAAGAFTATAFFRSGANKAIQVLVVGINPPETFDVYATVEQL